MSVSASSCSDTGSRRLSVSIYLTGALALLLNAAIGMLAGLHDGHSDLGKFIFANSNLCITAAGPLLSIIWFTPAFRADLGNFGKASLLILLPIYGLGTSEILRTYLAQERAHYAAMSARSDVEIAQVRARNSISKRRYEEHIAWLKEQIKAARKGHERNALKAELELRNRTPVPLEPEPARKKAIDVSEIIAGQLGISTSRYMFYEDLLTALSFGFAPIIIFGVAAALWPAPVRVHENITLDDGSSSCWPTDVESVSNPKAELELNGAPDLDVRGRLQRTAQRRRENIPVGTCSAGTAAGHKQAPISRVKKARSSGARRSSTVGDDLASLAVAKSTVVQPANKQKWTDPPNSKPTTETKLPVTTKSPTCLGLIDVASARHIERLQRRDGSLGLDCIGYWSRGPPPAA